MRIAHATLALAAVGVAVWAPEWLLGAEFARQRWRAGARRRDVKVADHRWRVLEAGAVDAPTIVLVHGFTGFKENWLPLMRALAPRYRLIAPDLPGWGGSERKPQADYGAHAQVERLAEFLRALPRRPTLLAGHSMGGQIVGLLAARHPQLVQRLALISSSGVRFEQNSFVRGVLRGDNPFGVTTRAELRRYLGIVFEQPPFVPWPFDEALVRRRRADADFERRVLDDIGRGPQAFALESELGAIRAPALLLWCRGDRVIDASAAARFAAGLADSRSVMLDGRSHMPMVERSDQTARAIEQFLR